MKLMLVPLLLLPILLTGCGTTIYSAPAWPVAGPAVASDLEKCCLPPEKYPALWEWLARVDKYKQKRDLQ